MIRTVVMAIIGLVVMAGSSIADAAVTLTLKDGVTVARDIVMLKDIATIAVDQQDAESLVLDEYVMCNAPRAGYSREVTKAYILMKLRQQGLSAELVHFSGSDTVVVRRGEAVVSINDQQKALHAWVCEQIDMPLDEVKVVCKSVMRDVCVPQGAVEIIFSGDRTSFMRRNVGVYAEFYVDGEFIVRKTVNFNLSLLKKIVLTKRCIARGEVIAASDVVPSQAFIDAFESNVCDDVSLIVGSVARHDIINGACIETIDIAQREMVKKGDVVTCVVVDGNMTLTVKLQACEDGKRGEMIRLLNATTNKTVSGRVIDEGKVTLCA